MYLESIWIIVDVFHTSLYASITDFEYNIIIHTKLKYLTYPQAMFLHKNICSNINYILLIVTKLYKAI